MPQLVIAVAASAGGAAVGAAIGTGIGATIAAAAATVVITATLDRALIGKPSKQDPAVEMDGRTLTVNSADETRKIIYGETRIGGSFVFFDPKFGSTDFVWYIIAVADHEIQSFGTLW